jgi:(p)ppGpp synthase/HD superfamily hydrolase
MGNNKISFISKPIEFAICLAVKAHARQLDKAGMPYILHPLRVMDAVKDQGESMMIAAVLHDAVEDSDLQLSAINIIFGEIVGAAIDALTRRKMQGEAYANFILRVKANRMATIIKIADLLDNLSRIDCLPPEERRITKRYEKALVTLRS